MVENSINPCLFVYASVRQNNLCPTSLSNIEPAECPWKLSPGTSFLGIIFNDITLSAWISHEILATVNILANSTSGAGEEIRHAKRQKRNLKRKSPPSSCHFCLLSSTRCNFKFKLCKHFGLLVSFHNKPIKITGEIKIFHWRFARWEERRTL